MTVPAPDRLLSAAEVAAILGFSPRTLGRWRNAGSGPPSYKFGHRVRYRWREVQAWAAGCRVRRTTADVPGGALNR